MKVTDKMVMACAREMSKYGWMEEDWDEVRQGGDCDCCGAHSSRNTQDHIDDTKNMIRGFLEAALKAAK
jgi:hypothetical protein